MENNNNIIKLNTNSGDIFSTKNKKDQQKFKDLNNEYFISNKWALFLPTILACMCYINGLNGDFVHDDIFAIKKNNDVIGRTPLSDVFVHDFWGTPMTSNLSHKSYRPLTVLTFRLNYRIHGPDPFFFHMVNVVLHGVVTLLVVFTCQHVFRLSVLCSFVTGLLFAVHPIHTEAVSGIVGRAELMATFFFLLSFICYAKGLDYDSRSRTNRTISSKPYGLMLLSFVLAVAAMFSKENGVTVIGICFIFDCVVSLQSTNNGVYSEKVLTSFVKRVTATVTMTLILMILRIWIMNGEVPTFTPHDNPASFHNNTLTRFMSHSYIWTYNIWLLLAPVTLCYDWQHGSIPLVERITDVRNLATLSLALLVLFLVMKSASGVVKQKKSTSLRFDSVFWSLVILSLPFIPATNIFFTVGFVLAERVLYISSIGFCMIVATGICRLIDRCPKHRQYVSVGLCLLLTLYCCKTWQQNNTWQSRETLFRSGINVMPQNAKVHYNYGNFLKDSGHFDEATRHYREAIRLDPFYASAHNNLGIQLKGTTDAEEHFREALRLQPTHQGALINLGNLLFNRGMRTEGLEYLSTAIEIEYRNPEALTAMAWCLIQLGNYTQAEHYLRTCFTVAPDYPQAYLHYGLLMNKLGRHKDAAQYFLKAHDLKPGHVTSLTNAADAYQHMGDFTRAELLLKQALSIRQDHGVLEQLAMMYYGAGRTQDSLAVFRDIEEMNTHNSSDTIIRYAKILVAEGEIEKANDILTNSTATFTDDTEFLVSAALIKSKLEKYNESVVLLTRAIFLAIKDMKGDLEMMYFDRGNNYKDMRQFDKALRDFDETLKFNPNHIAAHGNKGAIYHTKGDIKRAKYHYSRALELEPDNTIIKDNIVKLDQLKIQLERGII